MFVVRVPGKLPAVGRPLRRRGLYKHEAPARGRHSAARMAVYREEATRWRVVLVSYAVETRRATTMAARPPMRAKRMTRGAASPVGS